MRYIITGGSGVICRHLSQSLVADGHEVVVLSRNPDKQQLPAGVQGVKWDAATAAGWGHLLDGGTAIINLAGESISGNATIPMPWTWSDERKERIRQSRRRAGEAVVDAVAGAAVKPRVVYQISGIDYYPATDKPMTEEGPRGDHFLAGVVADYWEASTESVEALGVRRVVGRTAPILNLETGPLPASLLQFRLFAGGRLGSGKQWFSWIHTQDLVRAIRFLTDNEAASGVFNVATPNPVTNKEFTHILGQVMGRPTLIPVPEFALKLMLGEISSMVLDGRPVSVKKLEELGFTFLFPTLEAALRDVLGKG